MDNKFTEQEINKYRKKVDLIISKIKLYKNDLKKSNDFKFGQTGNEELQLERLEQAFTDLENFYEKGKKQWFRIYKDICDNYRFGKGLNGVWVKIESDYDSFWMELNLVEKLFVTMNPSQFRLPNLKKKSYGQFEDKLDNEFGDQLKTIDESYKIETIVTGDRYDVRIRTIATQNIYNITCTTSKVQVDINQTVKEEIVPKITDMLFNFIVGYLEI